MGQELATTEERYEALMSALLGEPGVEPPSGRGFGATALRTSGKIFAMLSSRDEFVIKLPGERVDALIAAGRGTRFDVGHKRPMRQWFAVASESDAEWLALAREALAFVAVAR